MLDISENPLAGCYVALTFEATIILWWLAKPYTFQKRYLWCGPLVLAAWVTVSIFIVTNGETIKANTKAVMAAFEAADSKTVMTYFHDDFNFVGATNKAALCGMVTKVLSKPFVDKMYVNGLESANVSDFGGDRKAHV